MGRFEKKSFAEFISRIIIKKGKNRKKITPMVPTVSAGSPIYLANSVRLAQA
jgi:predicted CopG family antitoxin